MKIDANHVYLPQDDGYAHIECDGKHKAIEQGVTVVKQNNNGDIRQDESNQLQSAKDWTKQCYEKEVDSLYKYVYLLG